MRNKWKLEFVNEMCERFAFGESINELADSTGNEPWEIEELLKENASAMEKAIRSVEESGEAGMYAGIGGVGHIAWVLKRIAVAVERIAAAQEIESKRSAHRHEIEREV